MISTWHLLLFMTVSIFSASYCLFVYCYDNVALLSCKTNGLQQNHCIAMNFNKKLNSYNMVAARGPRLIVLIVIKVNSDNSQEMS